MDHLALRPFHVTVAPKAFHSSCSHGGGNCWPPGLLVSVEIWGCEDGGFSASPAPAVRNPVSLQKAQNSEAAKSRIASTTVPESLSGTRTSSLGA